MKRKRGDTSEIIPGPAETSRELKHMDHRHQTLNALLAFMVLKRYSETDPNCSIDWEEIASTPSDIGGLLNEKISHIENIHPELRGWFEGLDISQALVHDDTGRDDTWRDVIAKFADVKLAPSGASDPSEISGTCLSITRTWSEPWSRMYEYYETPENIIQLETALIDLQDGASIYDPFCTRGRSLVVAAQSVMKEHPDAKIRLFGQTQNEDHVLTIRLNFLLAGHPEGKVAFGDIIRNPGFLEGQKKLARFDGIIGTLPLRLLPTNPELKRCAWAATKDDPFARFVYGIPPASHGEFVFIQHCIASLTPNGRMAIIVPPMLLDREHHAGAIRTGIIKDDLVEAVISLPNKMFDFTSIILTILVINRNKPTERKNKILFINAMQDFQFDKQRNVLAPEHIQKIVKDFQSFSDQEGYCRVCSLEEVEENGFILDVRRYVRQKRELPPPLDLIASLKELDACQTKKVEEYERLRVNLNDLVDYLANNAVR
jgi:type I restriction enzyme M protein